MNPRTLVLPLAAALGLLPGETGAQGMVEYLVDLRQPQTQVVEITVALPEVSGPTVDLALPTWRPGRYVILDPAGTLRDVRASSPEGRELPIEKIDKSTWRVSTEGDSTVIARYRVYANSLGDRTRHVDDTHAFLSGSSVFLYAPSHRSREVRVRIEAPTEWRVASGLEPVGDDPRLLEAASYDVLVDSPLEVGLHDFLEFEVGSKPHQYVLWPPGARYHPDHLIEDTTEIVREQLEIFGRLPYRRYVFLTHVGAGARGGTEHLNSTIMQTSLEALEGSFERDKTYRRFLGLVSHEFFHTWNVKQLRPAGIHPYDYQSENYTDLLWVSEGTTSYYGDLTLARAGLRKTRDYLNHLGELIDEYRRRPGAEMQSLTESSYDAWIKFNRRTPDDKNSTVSFYDQGELVSLALDLELRRRSANRSSLDSVMRTLFERFPLAGPGFRSEDLESALAAAGGSSFAPFFAAHVEGTEPLPLEDLLAGVGLELYLAPRRDDDEDSEEGELGDRAETAPAEGESDEGASEKGDAEPDELAYVGLELADEEGRARVRVVLADGPAYNAGVLAGDEIVALDGRRLMALDLKRRLEAYRPGEVVTLHLMRYDRLRTVEVPLAKRLDAEWKVRWTAEPTAAQRAAYQDWIGQPWPEPRDDSGS